MKLLVVDDDDAVRRVLHKHLSKSRLDVEAAYAADGEEAFRRVAELGQPSFDVVLTNLSMAPWTGLDLFRALRAARYRMPVIVMTGFAPNGPEELAVFDEVLAKPFSRGELDDCLERHL